MNKKILLLVLPVIFTAQSCNFFSTSDKGSGHLGIFLSVDSADSWHEASGTANLQLGSTAVSKIFIQQDDPKNIVAASSNGGVLASDSHGENWVVLLSAFSAQDIFINPFDEQEIFASGSKGKLASIYRSLDRGATWIQVYNEPSGESSVTAMAFDPQDPKIMYAGLSTGTMLKSTDAGDTWQRYAAFKDRVTDISVTADSVYALSTKSGFHKSLDGAETWTSIKVDKTVKIHNALLVDPDNDSTLYVGSDVGLMRSTDAGETWTKLPLPASLKVSNVTAVQFNPDNSSEIFAAVRSTIYRSSDDGATWRTVQLPTNRVIGDIAIDPEEPNRIFTGIRL